MSISKVPKIKPTRANRPRNGFDLSQRHLFTAHAGMLLPILSLDLLPGDHVEINAKDFMRTVPMKTAPFLSMRGVYEFYAVPYKQLWSGFDQFITGMSDFRSTPLYTTHGKKAPKTVPYFNLEEMHKYMRENFADSNVDQIGFPVYEGSQRLFDLLGYSRYSDVTGKVYRVNSTDKFVGNILENVENSLYKDNILKYSVAPWRILAYNKIYFDYYRNSSYEDVDPSLFNIDHFSGKITADAMSSRFRLRYRNSRLDYLTNIRPSQLFTSDVDFSDIDRHVSLGVSSLGGKTDYMGASADSAHSYSFVDSNSGTVRLNVNSIRSAYAVDKLLSVTMRAGKSYKEQIAAHYGVDVPEGRDGNCHYLGGFDSNFNISDIDQTSATTQVEEYSVLGGYLGRTVGKGVGSGSGRVTYDAKEHCVLMCIYSIVPDFQFDSVRLDPMVSKISRFDYFTPEFENLGMQPLQVQNITTASGIASSVLGWQPRYSEYKTAVDVNHGQFSMNGPLSHYSVSRFRDTFLFRNLPGLGLSSLKINPRWLDNVFAVDYNGKETTDCAFGGCYFNIVKISNMSVDGMPRV